MPRTSATEGGRIEYASVRPRSRAAWRAWLQRHHASSKGVWVVMAKKHTGLASVSYNDAVEEALCFGWIDTTLNPIDATHYKQLFTPRRPRSTWAASNKARVERLIAQGLMTPAGLAVIEVARQNGSWTSLDETETLTPPPELTAALKKTTKAWRQWLAYRPSRQKQFLFWLAGARRPETRAWRVARIVECAIEGITLEEYRERSGLRRSP
jgi:uncharacterized protein YdeI (YjbR/CyaY-like superfamily)